MASSPITSVDEILIALLDRVVQEVFRVGFRLRANSDEAITSSEAQRLVAHLGAVVEDIRETVMTWQFGEDRLASGPREVPLALASQSTDEASSSSGDREIVAGRAIPYLRLASEVLEHPVDADFVTPDGGRWIAINHAVHHLHASIAALQNSWPDGAA